MKFEYKYIERCIECKGCENDCPAFKTFKDYNPIKIYLDILKGNFEKWLESEIIWECMECHTCSELCHQNYSWEKVITTLKNESIKRGLAPKTVKKGIETFLKTGRLGEPKTGARKKLNLPEPPKIGIEDFKKIIKLINIEEDIR
jgi:heterodisulfide reductase subunit C